MGFAAEPTPGEVFEKRIMPIFKSSNPSSCVQCHLAGVDLKNYILPDAEKTFRSLRDQKLIDLDNPEKSKIVVLIDMGGTIEGTPAVSAKLRKAEREAFLDWIRACAADPKLRATTTLDAAELAAPPRPVEVIRHARKDRVLESFEANVWLWRFRCMNCHTEGTPQTEKYVKEYGDRVAWVKKAGAQATMDYLIESKLIDLANPEKSLLLRKSLGDQHKGGVKFAVGDMGYQGFRTWLDDVAAIRGDKYATADALPKAAIGPARFGSKHWLKLTDCPPAWADKLLLVRIFAWDAKAGNWEPKPIATSDRLVATKGDIWQHSLLLLTDKDSDRAKGWRDGTPTLPEGKYQVRLYLDANGKLAKDWKATLGEDAAVGQVEFTGKWREGYNAMTVVPVVTPK